jgi:hypothetical protein
VGDEAARGCEKRRCVKEKKERGKRMKARESVKKSDAIITTKKFCSANRVRVV